MLSPNFQMPPEDAALLNQFPDALANYLNQIDPSVPFGGLQVLPKTSEEEQAEVRAITTAYDHAVLCGAVPLAWGFAMRHQSAARENRTAQNRAMKEHDRLKASKAERVKLEADIRYTAFLVVKGWKQGLSAQESLDAATASE